MNPPAGPPAFRADEPAERPPDADQPADLAPDQATDRAPDQATDRAPDRASELTEQDRQILAFERRWWRHAGAKEQAIRDSFGLSATRYYQLLNRLLDEPAAERDDPVLVHRLRRLRAARALPRPRVP